jgi:hypothetical protein
LAFWDYSVRKRRGLTKSFSRLYSLASLCFRKGILVYTKKTMCLLCFCPI